MGEARRRGTFEERRAAARIRGGYDRTPNVERPAFSPMEERLACFLEWALVIGIAALAAVAALAVGRQAARAWRERGRRPPEAALYEMNWRRGVYGDELCGFTREGGL